jgi:hypothetical protein
MHVRVNYCWNKLALERNCQRKKLSTATYVKQKLAPQCTLSKQNKFCSTGFWMDVGYNVLMARLDSVQLEQ